MKIAFFDCSGWTYDLDAPYERPMGGTESALCYLAAELARNGHQVMLYNGSPEPKESHGVQIRNLSEAQGQPGSLDANDVVIACGAAVGRFLRENCQVKVPLVLWTQHAPDQPAVKPLISMKEQESWSAVVYVSDWQRKAYESYFSLSADKGQVMRNAAGPAFLAGVEGAPWYMRGDPPVLFYTSTPFRGLDVLLKAFPAIRAAIPGTTLSIYSSMNVYQIPKERDQYVTLYDQAQATEGVNYVGSVGQRQLADELAGNGAALAYPSIFAETSCIAAIEAMAIGAEVITTRLGALPETCGGHACMIDAPPVTSLADRYAELAIERLKWTQENPELATAGRFARVGYVRNRYTWPARAKEWESWLWGIAGNKPQAIAAE